MAGLGYPIFYAVGYLSNSAGGSAPIWPSLALNFVACLLLPGRLWTLVALGVVVWELVALQALLWLTLRVHPTLADLGGYAAANILTAIGPAALARAMRLYRRQARPALLISPLWIVALFGGALPGACLGALTRANGEGTSFVYAQMWLWLLSAVLTIVTFGPMVLGSIVGFKEAVRAPARAWEGWTVALAFGALFACFAVIPVAGDPLVAPMLLAAPLAWLALRFSHRATNFGVVFVATGVVTFAGHRIGIYRNVASVESWEHIVMSIDVFLLIGCGGALLVNLMTLKQRELLDELAHEHLALRDYARALTSAEETARRKTAADLHDGIGQVLAGQSMTLAAMRAHTSGTPLSTLLEEAAAASREAQEGLRAMIQDLAPPELDQASLAETIRWLADFFETRFGFEVTWHVTGEADLPRDSMRLIYRCVRELLMNARKHSKRRCAEVEIDLSQPTVEIMVLDEGIGFSEHPAPPLSGNRFGLAQLRERVRAAGGTVDLDTAAGEGCRVIVRLPPHTPLPG